MNIEVNVLEVLEYSPMFTPANTSFSIILRGGYQQLQNNILEHGNTDKHIRSHTRVQS